jgi:uncharacterized peroxidase-related enzyme
LAAILLLAFKKQPSSRMSRSSIILLDSGINRKAAPAYSVSHAIADGQRNKSDTQERTMSRLTTINPADATGATADIFAVIKKAVGKVPNAYATIGTNGPEALGAMLAADAVIGKGTLTKSDVEAIRLAVSEKAGCDYCVAAHTLMGKLAGLSPETMKQVRGGQDTGDTKRDALLRFVRSLIGTSGTVPAAEVDAVQAAGYTERQIVEISLTIAQITFTNLMNRVNDTTLDFPAVA